MSKYLINYIDFDEEQSPEIVEAPSLLTAVSYFVCLHPLARIFKAEILDETNKGVQDGQ